MMLVDTSVWIEELRTTRFERFRELRHQRPDDIAVTEPVLMEVLAGAARPELVQARLAAVPLRSVEPGVDYVVAASIFRHARSSGFTIRSLEDCLIAAVALRLDDTVVHRDADFEHIATVTGLTTLDLRS